MRSELTSKDEIEADSLTKKVIGLAIELHRALGKGRREQVYKEALERVLCAEGLDVETEREFDVEVAGCNVGKIAVDLWIEDELIVELKVVRHLRDEHLDQLGRYVETADICRGLLLNFGEGRLRIQRFTNFDAPVPRSILRTLE